MRHAFIASVMVGMGFVAGGACAQPASTAELAIRPAIAKMLQAANAHDTDAFMASMLRSRSLVFAIDGKIIHGWAALHAQQLQWWQNGRSRARYVQNGKPEFEALGPGVEVVTWPLASNRSNRDGTTVTDDFVVTYIWRRLPQGWRIVYGHESWSRPPG